jgi:hypothetical protein
MTCALVTLAGLGLFALDRWVRQPLAALVAANERTAQLDEIIEANARRAALKLQAVEDLLAGRIGLAQAVARFEEAQRGTGEYEGLRSEFYASRTPWERRCREVLQYVRMYLADDPTEAARVLPWLEAEFEEYCRE